MQYSVARWPRVLELSDAPDANDDILGRHCPLSASHCGFKKLDRIRFPSPLLDFLTSMTASLQVLYPDLATEWHPERNGDLTPRHVTAGSNRKVWWRCSVDPAHEWEAIVQSRVRGNGCPYCAGQRATPATCLRSLHPAVANEWHPSKNGTLTPCDVLAGSAKKVWWRCSASPLHEWKAEIRSRSRGGGCPICASLATTHPHLAAEWHSEKNGTLTPKDVSRGSARRVWWKCSVDPSHEWTATPNDRTNGTGCPICAGKVATHETCLQILFPNLASEWHPEKNEAMTPNDVTPGSGKKVWWRCSVDPSHEWEAAVYSRVCGNGCPVCSGQLVTPRTSLQTLYPNIAAEWHTEKNGSLSPNDVTAGSGHIAWWRWSSNPAHEWQAVVHHRVYGTGCPICAGRVAAPDTCLQTLHPDIADEWHPNKNGDLTPRDVVLGSNRKVWWRCSVDPSHVWQAVIHARTRLGSGCPFCTIAPRSRDEIWLACELRAFFDFDIHAHKLMVGEQIFDLDILIPQLQLVIEFDGSYWHQNSHSRDISKTMALTKAGWHVIRAREKPLTPLGPNDVTVPLHSPKVTANRVLLKIEEVCGFRIEGLAGYLQAESLFNEQLV